MFELIRNSEVPLVDQICERVTQLVRHGQLTPGTRLPSIRKLARQVSASPFTVVDAYDRLVARGVIESRADHELFGIERLDAVLAAHAGATPQNLANAVLAACREFAGGDLPDDCAVVVLRRT